MKRGVVTIGAAATAVALAAGIGVAGTDEAAPVAGWIDSPAVGGAVSGEPDLLTVRAPDTAWTVATYLSDRGLICFAAGPAGERRAVPSGGASCFGGLPLAAGFAVEGPVRPTFGTLDASYRERNIAYGVVDNRATKVTFVLGGKRRAAKLSSATTSVPVRATGRLTAAGKRLLARLPRTVEVRAFALPFDDRLGARHVRVETVFADGSVHRQKVAGAPQPFRK